MGIVAASRRVGNITMCSNQIHCAGLVIATQPLVTPAEVELINGLAANLTAQDTGRIRENPIFDFSRCAFGRRASAGRSRHSEVWHRITCRLVRHPFETLVK